MAGQLPQRQQQVVAQRHVRPVTGSTYTASSPKRQAWKRLYV
jgi:hypothetical protein